MEERTKEKETKKEERRGFSDRPVVREGGIV